MMRVRITVVIGCEQRKLAYTFDSSSVTLLRAEANMYRIQEVRWE